MSIDAHLLPALLVFCRAYAFVFTFSPVRLYLRSPGAIVLAIALTVWCAEAVPQVKPGALFFPALVELARGFALAYPYALAFEVFGMIGRTVNLLRGAQLSEQHLPLFGERVSVSESALTLGAAAVIVDTGAPLALAELFRRSLAETPPLSLVDASQFSRVLFALVAVLTLPLVYSLLSETVSGIAGRLIGRAPLAQELAALKLVALPALLALALAAAPPRLLQKLVFPGIP